MCHDGDWIRQGGEGTRHKSLTYNNDALSGEAYEPKRQPGLLQNLYTLPMEWSFHWRQTLMATCKQRQVRVRGYQPTGDPLIKCIGQFGSAGVRLAGHGLSAPIRQPPACARARLA
jgi:hypothetical protein